MGVTDDVLREKGGEKKKEEEGLKESSVSFWNVLGKQRAEKSKGKKEERRKKEKKRKEKSKGIFFVKGERKC